MLLNPSTEFQIPMITYSIILQVLACSFFKPNWSILTVYYLMIPLPHFHLSFVQIFLPIVTDYLFIKWLQQYFQCQIPPQNLANPHQEVKSLFLSLKPGQSLCDFPDNQNAVEVTHQASEARLEKVIVFCLALSTDALGTSHHAVRKPRP